MKNYFSSVITFVMVLASLSCSREDQPVQPSAKGNGSARIGDANVNSTCACGSCGATLSDSWTGNGGHTYTVALSFPDDCIPQGTSISFGLDANQYPNKFSIKDPNGNTVVTSASVSNSSDVDGWMGASNKSTGGFYTGPWRYYPGALSNGGLQKPNTGTISINKQFSTYYLVVEASVQPQNDGTEQLPPQQDSWQVIVSCGQ